MTRTAALLALALVLPLVAQPTKPNIVQTAVAAGQFNTLVAAVKAAGLVDTLSGPGPFTVFAPSDAAFDKLPKGTIASLLKPENKDQLVAILTYHVVPGKLMAKDVLKRKALGTANGQRAAIAMKNDAATIAGATIVKTDIGTSNGVIHVVDTVMMPESNSIVGVAKKVGKFNTLLAAATTAGLANTLGTDGPFTVFAPTDEAFAKLPAGTVESLLKPENKDKLVAILKAHVISGRIHADQAIAEGKATTLGGFVVKIAKQDNGSVTASGCKIVGTDVPASNGVIHVIDSVILPK